MMIDIHQALEIERKVQVERIVEDADLHHSLNRILAEDVFSDVDMPLFDKSAMDGYACRREDLPGPLTIIGTLHAGDNNKFTVASKTCVKIMTGARIPEGADTVIVIEHTEQIDNDTIRFTKKEAKSNISKCGEDIRKGGLLLEKGTHIRPHHLAILASAGAYKIKVFKQPRVILCSTGNELVEPDKKPEGTQIRNTNAYNLSAQLAAMGIQGHYKGILEDEKTVLKNKIAEYLHDCDVLILTGGASKGEFDFIPSIFRESNFAVHFDQVAVQPGKPVSFSEGNGKFCFGLSGNPVSSLLQFELLVKPFIFHYMGHRYEFKVHLTELSDRIFRQNTERLKFFPVKFNSSGQAQEIKFNGSAHITGLTGIDGFGLIPLGCEGFNAGEKVEILLFP